MGAKTDTKKQLDIYAKSVFRELKTHGYSRAEIVAFASDMLELLADDVRTGARAEAADPAA